MKGLPRASEASRGGRHLARALLRVCLPARLREAIAGDIEEQWHGADHDNRRLLARGAVVDRRLLARAMRSAHARASDSGDWDVPGGARARCALRRAHDAAGPGIHGGGRLHARASASAAAPRSSARLNRHCSTLCRTRTPNASLSICDRGQNGTCVDVTFGTYREVLARSRSSSRCGHASVAARRHWRLGDPERLEGQRVSAAYFDVLGIPPAPGAGSMMPTTGPARRVSCCSATACGAAASVRSGRDRTRGPPRRCPIHHRWHPAAHLRERPRAAGEIWTPLQYDPRLPRDGREWGHHLRWSAGCDEGVTVAAAATSSIASPGAPTGRACPWASLGTASSSRRCATS